jgi:hypothetical protein
MAGAVCETRGRSDHAVAVGTEGRESQRHLACEALDATDLSADRCPSVDRDLGLRPVWRQVGRPLLPLRATADDHADHQQAHPDADRRPDVVAGQRQGAR